MARKRRSLPVIKKYPHLQIPIYIYSYLMQHVTLRSASAAAAAGQPATHADDKGLRTSGEMPYGPFRTSPKAVKTAYQATKKIGDAACFLSRSLLFPFYTISSLHISTPSLAQTKDTRLDTRLTEKKWTLHSLFPAGAVSTPGARLWPQRQASSLSTRNSPRPWT